MRPVAENRSALRDLRELPARHADVLVAVLHRYVNSGEPVGSRDAIAESGLAVSSATVRGAMSDLMELGLLEQPHTSAGRVPTEAAFRMWVDHLLAEPEPSRGLRPRAARELVEVARELAEVAPEQALRRAADVLTLVTGQLGFCLATEREHLRLAQLRFVRASSERVLALLISESGAVRTRLIEERDCDARRLERVSAALTRLVAGLSLEEARARLAAEIDGDRAQHDALWRQFVALGRQGLAVEVEAELYVGDRRGLLDQREFDDSQRLRGLLAALDEKQRMLALLDKVLASGGPLRVWIGEELGDPDISACAVVAEPVGPHARFGGLGVIGPVRMRYDRVIPAVRSVTGRLESALA